MKKKTIKKSTLTTEKSGILAIAMSLLSIGVATLTSASQHLECTWNGALEITFGISMLASGMIILKLREYLKLNRWSHVEVVCDNSLIQRMITRIERD